ADVDARSRHRSDREHLRREQQRRPTHGRKMKWIAVVALLLAAPAATQWTPPRTTWGDPDLQGSYANNNEYAMPLERPEEFAGKRARDLTAAEIAEARRLAQQRMLAALPGGEVRGPDDWWLQNLDLTKRSRVWSIVDPPDGRIPPLTPAGAARAL